MKFYKKILMALLVFTALYSCKKDDDSTSAPIIEPTNDIEGSFWVHSETEFTELNLQDAQETNSYTTLDTFECTEFDGVFICSQGAHSETKTLIRKNSFNGENVWTKDYAASTEHYYSLDAIEVHQSIVFISYSIIDKNTYASTYYLEALEMDTGNNIWRITLANGVRKMTSFEGQIILELAVGSSTVELLSINASTGNIDHRLPFTERIGRLKQGTSSIYVMTWNNNVISMDNELNFNWTFETDGPNLLGGIEVDNQFLFYSRDKTVYSLNKNNGTLIWKNSYLEDYPKGISIFNDKVYIRNVQEADNIKIKTLDLSSGEEIDSYTLENTELLDDYNTKFYSINQYLLIFKVMEFDNKSQVSLINIADKAVLWNEELNPIAYSHLIITPATVY